MVGLRDLRLKEMLLVRSQKVGISTVLYLISEMSGKDEFLKTDLFKDIRKLINIID